MPSPVGHTLIASAFWLAWCLPRSWTFQSLIHDLRPHLPLFALCVFICNAPDLDYLVGIGGNMNHTHHWYTHTVGWALLLASGCFLFGRFRNRQLPAYTWWILAAMSISHLAADALCMDHSQPQGIMALWPINDRFLYNESITVFLNLEKDTWSDIISLHNTQAILLEVAILGPLPIIAMIIKSHQSKKSKESA